MGMGRLPEDDNGHLIQKSKGLGTSPTPTITQTATVAITPIDGATEYKLCGTETFYVADVSNGGTEGLLVPKNTIVQVPVTPGDAFYLRAPAATATISTQPEVI